MYFHIEVTIVLQKNFDVSLDAVAAKWHQYFAIFNFKKNISIKKYAINLAKRAIPKNL